MTVDAKQRLKALSRMESGAMSFAACLGNGPRKETAMGIIETRNMMGASIYMYAQLSMDVLIPGKEILTER